MNVGAKGRWASAALRERLAAQGEAEREFLEMSDEDRNAGLDLVRAECHDRQERKMSAVYAFYSVFGWVPTVADLVELGVAQ